MFFRLTGSHRVTDLIYVKVICFERGLWMKSSSVSAFRLFECHMGVPNLFMLMQMKTETVICNFSSLDRVRLFYYTSSNDYVIKRLGTC